MIRKLLQVLLYTTVVAAGAAQAALQLDASEQAAFKSMEGKKLKICIFDPIGANGPAVGYAKDYMLEAKRWGLNSEVKAYTDERVAAEDLKAGQCDAAAITTLRAKQFNKFVGSLDAVGAIPDMAQMDIVLNTLASPKMAPLMVSGQFEVVGIIPLGAAYVFVRDRAINSIQKAAGKRVAVMDWDKSQAKLVQRMGAQPVASDVINFVSKFNNGQVDIIAAPAIVYKPLEAYRGLGEKGAIYRFPLVMLSAALIVRRDRITPEIGQKLRSFVVTQIGKAYDFVEHEEKGIPERYWLDLPAHEKTEYVEMMRQARIQMTADGDYDPRMMKLLKRVRCSRAPAAAECALNDE